MALSKEPVPREWWLDLLLPAKDPYNGEFPLVQHD